MSFYINPCKACMNKCKRTGDCNINTINSCIVQTNAAFSNLPNNNVITNNIDANRNWENCMRSIMKSEGRTPCLFKQDNNSQWPSQCDFQLNMSPAWVEEPTSPYLFPSLFLKLNDIDRAKQVCFNNCKYHRYSNQCTENCITASEALIGI